LLAAEQAWEAKHHQPARLEADGKVYWTGKKESNADEYWELALEGNLLIERRGKIGKGRPRTEKETCRDRESALRSALIKMMCAMNILRFGP
jgi:hypothetical protein